MAFLREDNTEVIFKMNEGDKVVSKSNLGKLYYFEVYLAKGKHMAIQLESESSKFIYNNRTSSLHNVNGHTSTITKTSQEGDVLSFSCSFWRKEAFEESKSTEKYYSLGQFML